MLTTEQQKRLMIFLGECWHDFADMFDQGGPSDNVCIHCGKLEPVCSNIDFTDWRVVGRLIEKCKPQQIIIHTYDNEDGEYTLCSIRGIERIRGNPQEAICLAIDSYLQEREGE